MPKPKYIIVTDLIRLILNKFEFADEESLEMADYYPKWDDMIGQPARHGAKFTHAGILYEVVERDHIFEAEWEPSVGMALVYRPIETVTPQYTPEVLSSMQATHAEWLEHQEASKQPDPTIDTRVTTVENELADIQTAYQEGVNNA